MMTALQIEEHDGGIFRFLRRNRIRVEHRYCDAAALKCVTYEHYRGKVNWQAIDRFVKAQRNRVLCPPDMILPADSGYKRYVSHELSRRMCENAALYLLRTAQCRGVKAVLVDPSGDSVGMTGYLAEYCDPVYAVSDAVDLYEAQAEYLLNEMGAALRVCRGKDCLYNADLIIAPQQLTEALPCPSNALILTGEKPAVPQNATAVYEYFIDLPSKLQQLCPPFLREMYFASALYATAQVRALGSEVFSRCGDGNILHTRMSLAETFKNRVRSHSDS